MKIPSRMEVQSARRAQPRVGLIQLPTGTDRSTQDTDTRSTTTARPPSSQLPTVAKPAESDLDTDSAFDEQRTPTSGPSLEGGPKRLPPAKGLSESSSESAKGRRSPKHSPDTHATEPGILFTTQSPVLSVEATGPRKVLIGKEALFVVKIHNSGATANNVLVTVNIPHEVDVASSQASVGATQSPGQGERHEPLEWKIDRLESKTSETLNLKLVPRKSAPLDLAVKYTFTPEASQTLVEVQEPKLAMTISGPEEVQYGQSKIYKLTISNPGNGDSENVVVGLLPIGRATEGASSHRLGTVRAGESKTIDVELSARQAGAITIKAQAFADGGLRAEASEQVMVRRASLRIDVEAPKVKYAGTVGTFHVKVVNAGNATADNVQVSAVLPPDAKYITSNGGGRFEPQQGKINWAVGTLQPGGERTLDMQCSLSTPGENRMQFVSMADGNLSAAATSTTRVEALADLKLEVRDPQGPIAVGEETVYEVHVRNRGTKAAHGVDLSVFFSEGLEATSVEGGSHEIGPGQVIFKPIATVGAGDTAVYRVHARADKSGNHIFRAEVVCQSLHTKLAAEEATHFYGDDKEASAEADDEGQPRSSTRLDPTPLERVLTEEESTEEAPSEDVSAEEAPTEEAPNDDAPELPPQAAE